VNLFVAALVVASAMTSLQKALDSSATWTMERRLPGSSRVFLSSGTVTGKAGQGILWEVKEPFASSVEMTTNSMIFVEDGNRRVKPLDELPYYADFRRATDAFVAGDRHAFDGVFTIEECAMPGDGWKIILTPTVSAMRRLIGRVELTGDALPTNAVLESADGGSSVIRFKELPRVR